MALPTLDRVATRAAVRELHRARRRRRVEDIDWADALYKAYLAAVVAILVLVGLSILAGAPRVTPATIRDARDHGAAAVGLLVALLLAAGLRSGSRGGPLALERADVNHVLLAPVDRASVLRHAAWRQLRPVVLVGPVLGAVVGNLAGERLGGARAEWVVCGAIAGLAIATATWGAALLCSGRRWSRTTAAVLGAALLAWSAADLVAGTTTSPASLVGRFVLWPLAGGAVSVVGVALAFAVPVVAMLAVRGTLVEASERRASLVGQLRFAATLQDVRTVIVLHRQLSQERSRSRPWVRIPGRGRAALGTWRRDWQCVLRWPGSRALRVAFLGAVVGASLVGVWHGTVGLVALAGLALFVVGLEAVEPLAQEVDHPTRADALPHERGDLYVRHLPAAAILVALVDAVALGVAAGLGAPGTALAVIGIGLVPAAVAAACAAALAVVLGAPKFGGSVSFGFPEMASFVMFLRQAFPPALAIASVVPVALAERRVAHHTPQTLIAANGVFPVLVLSGCVVVYLLSRRAELA